MRKLLLLCAFGLLLAGQAKAQPSAAFNGTESGAGTTVLGTTPITIQTATGIRYFLAIQLHSSGAQVACRTDGGTPAINDGVSWQLGISVGVLGWVWAYPGFVPNGAVVCISSVASTALMVSITDPITSAAVLGGWE